MLKRGENIGVFALLICIKLQIYSITECRLIKNNITPIKYLYAIKHTGILLYCEKIVKNNKFTLTIIIFQKLFIFSNLL